MLKSTGTTYGKYKFKCQLPQACRTFDSMWDAGECYEQGGRLVKKCTELNPVENDVEECGTR
jgi:hypothetical protein